MLKDRESENVFPLHKNNSRMTTRNSEITLTLIERNSFIPYLQNLQNKTKIEFIRSRGT